MEGVALVIHGVARDLAHKPVSGNDAGKFDESEYRVIAGGRLEEPIRDRGFVALVGFRRAQTGEESLAKGLWRAMVAGDHRFVEIHHNGSQRALRRYSRPHAGDPVPREMGGVAARAGGRC